MSSVQVVVFGASWCQPGDALYEESVSLGKEIAAAGYRLVNGGYGGTMEGTAKGAAEVDGSSRLGVIVSSLFPYRVDGANSYLTEVKDTPSLLSRIASMVEENDVFVIMKGTLGTLTELCAIWNTAALAEQAGQVVPLVIAYRDPWERVVSTIVGDLRIPAAHASRIVFVDSAAEAMKIITHHKASLTE